MAVTAAVFAVVLVPSAALALSTLPLSMLQSVVMVICDDRQGSGVIIDQDGGYVLTAGHVVTDIGTGRQADSCRIGFVTDESLEAESFSSASVEYSVFSDSRDMDFAILKRGQHMVGPGVSTPLPLLTYEFAGVGDSVTVFGYPVSRGGKLTVLEGVIEGYSRGLTRITAVIEEGFSGGPAIHDNLGIIGVASRINTDIGPKGEERESRYFLSDILTALNWMDAEYSGPGGHEKYVEHADPARYYGSPLHMRDESLGCSDLVRSQDSSSVYCFLPGDRRLVFPDEAVYKSWYPDFSGVVPGTGGVLSEYRLAGNVTFRPGSLIKLVTDPRVYVVADGAGTVRWITSEERAAELFGEDWAVQVRDIPDTFFVDYKFGPPIE